jgi:nucleoside-triphosphatase
MAQSYLLTGCPGVGKTTAIEKIIHGLGAKNCGGFYTEEFRVRGTRRGFRVVTLDGRSGTLADVSCSTAPHKVGKYGVDLSFLESVALASIPPALASKLFMVIDEMGPMQMLSAKFQKAVLEVLKSPVPLVGTISESNTWLSDLTEYGNIELFILTEANRDQIPTMILERLRGGDDVGSSIIRKE